VSTNIVSTLSAVQNARCIQYAQHEISKRVAFDCGRRNLMITTKLAYIRMYAGRTRLYLSVYRAEKVEERARVMFNAVAAALNYAMPTEGGSPGILQTVRITMPPSPL